MSDADGLDEGETDAVDEPVCDEDGETEWLAVAEKVDETEPEMVSVTV